MPRLTLPDRSVREYDGPVTPANLAADISPGLAKAAIGARVNGELVDLDVTIETDADVNLVTTSPGNREPDADALYLIRHSCAHVMAEAVQRIIPEALLVYGPPVSDGFYYDISIPDHRPLSSDDFEAIEKEMKNIIAEKRSFQRYELPVDEGLKKLHDEGSKYKLDNAERAVQGGSDALSWYATGEPNKNWEDLCRGPHVPDTSYIGAFKIMSLASSYWHGDSNSDRLTRIYGTAFPHKKHLSKYLKQIEEAKARDHRVLGKKFSLFHIDDTVGQGLILWTPNGAVVRRELEEFIRAELIKSGYRMVYTPHIGKLDLYKTSGHFPYYRESQYPPLIQSDNLTALASEGKSCGDLANLLSEGDLEGYLLKPMNCPHHIKIYDSEPRSYRDLPLRLGEFGTVYRWEQSGELNGMTRVRGLTQDDAHLFCAEDQVGDEVRDCLRIVRLIWSTLGLENGRVRVGLRDPDSTKYTGDPAVWDKAEEACRDAAASLDMPFSEEAGEAAFYGPKIDFIVPDALGREWQLGTVQVDYNLPERFDLSYIGRDNKPHRPVMIHRAPFGSMERFIGLLIEHFAASFPTWLAPEQVRVLPISDKFMDYAEQIQSRLLQENVRVGIDRSDERVQAKIKVGAEAKIPYLLIVGGKDKEAGTVSVRKRGVGDLGGVPTEQFVDDLLMEIRERRLPQEGSSDE